MQDICAATSLPGNAVIEISNLQTDLDNANVGLSRSDHDNADVSRLCSDHENADVGRSCSDYGKVQPNLIHIY